MAQRGGETSNPLSLQLVRKSSLVTCERGCLASLDPCNVVSDSATRVVVQ